MALGRRHVVGRRVRAVVNWLNLTSVCGVLVAAAGRARPRHTGGGVLVAGGYRLRIPIQTCFTVGNVIVTRHPAEWLLDDRRAELLRHETRHSTQYAILGPVFWPAYALASAWSVLVAGDYGSHNLFERWAGLAAGDYEHAPLRPWLRRLAARRASR